MILAWILKKYNPLKNFDISSNNVIGIFSIKVLVGFFLFIIYTYYYKERTTADNFRFFDDAIIMNEALWKNPEVYFRMLFGIDADYPGIREYSVRMFNWDKEYNYLIFNDNRTMLRLNAIMMIFSFGNYHVHTLFMCMLSLLGGIYLFKSFYPFLKDKKYLLWYSITLVPSVCFWTSGVLKEGFLFLGIGLTIYGVFLLTNQYKKPKSWLIFLFGIAIMLMIKIYIIICLLPAIIYFTSGHYILKNRPILYFIIFHLVGFFGAWLLSIYDPKYDIFYILHKKKDDFRNVAMYFGSGSYFSTPYLGPHPLDLLVYAPFAIFTMLFRPFVWEGNNLMVTMAGVENLLTTGIVILSMFYLRKLTISQVKIILFLLSFVILVCIIVGLPTVVWGALVRYKIPIIPFIFIILLMITNTEKIKKHFGLKQL